MTYWNQRQHLNYYKQVQTWLEELEYDSLIDVGSADTPVATFGKFKSRTAINKDYLPTLEGVKCIKSDWMEIDLQADVITCLQVLEHLETEFLKQFVSKIFSNTKIAIISVPYMWQKGMCKEHLQDPISISKFLSFVEIEPKKIEIINDKNVERLTALFEVR